MVRARPRARSVTARDRLGIYAGLGKPGIEDKQGESVTKGKAVERFTQVHHGGKEWGVRIVTSAKLERGLAMRR